MGCGKARFGRNAKKTPKIENFGLKVCSSGPRDDPHMRPRGSARWDLEATRKDLEATCNDSLFPIIAACLEFCAKLLLYGMPTHTRPLEVTSLVKKKRII